jgi:uncharacterized protein YbcI
MSGFTFRYRLSGKPPTVRGFPFDAPATLGRGDLLNLRSGEVMLGKTGDTALVGAALEGLDGDPSQTSIRTIVDPDAVYGVTDPRSRRKGSTLDLAGESGAQGVSAGVNHDFVVDVASREDDETLVRIATANHYAPEDSAVRAEGLVGGALNAAIARTIVRYHAEQLGRGPTKAQAFHRDNLIVVVLEDTMTRAERTLVASGGTDAVLHTRRAFQDSLAPYLRSAIERLTGCTVRAFMSANHLDPDLAGEMFVLDRAVPGQPAHADGADAVD